MTPNTQKTSSCGFLGSCFSPRSFPAVEPAPNRIAGLLAGAERPACSGVAGTPVSHSEQSRGSIVPVVVRDLAAAFEVVAADPTLRVDIFESDWTQLDRDRERAAQQGLADRINFHHRAAFQCPFVRFLLERSRAAVVLIDRAA